MATFIEVDGTKTEVTPRDPKRGFELEELYALLGCQLVETVPMPGRQVLVIDEEGKLELPPREINVVATQMARAHGRLLRGDVIVGPALLCRIGSEFR